MALEWTLAEMRIFGALLLAACIPLCFGPSRRVIARLCARLPVKAMTVVLIAFTVIVVSYALLGLVWPVYPDDVEKDVVAIAWWWTSGHPMYPSAGSLEQYGLFPYGPLSYEIIGNSLRLFGASVFATVLPSTFALAACAGGMMWLGQKAGASRWRAIAVSMLVVVAVRTMWPWARPDPMNIAVVVAACALALNRKGWAIVVMVGVLAGLSTALKLHGVFYVAPALALMAGTTFSKLVIRGLTFAPFAIAAALLPFLVPGAGLDSYIFMLRETAKDGGTVGILISNLLYIGMFVGAAVLVPRAEWTGPGEDPLPAEREKLLLLALVICGIAVSFAGSKHGAGPHHLLPFLPFAGLMIARRIGTAPIGGEARYLMLAFLVGLHPVSEIWKTTNTVFANWSKQDAGRRQIAELARANPGRRLGLIVTEKTPEVWRAGPPGDTDSLYLYLVFAGSPLRSALATQEQVAGREADYLWLVAADAVNFAPPEGCSVTSPGEPFNVVECNPR